MKYTCHHIFLTTIRPPLFRTRLFSLENLGYYNVLLFIFHESSLDTFFPKAAVIRVTDRNVSSATKP